MEQHKLVIDSANIHTSRMTSARKHACMRNWKTTNPSSGLDRTKKILYAAKRHTCAHVSTHSLTYDKWTKKIENAHKFIIRARWNNKTLLVIQQTYTHLLVQAHARSRMTSARRHACMKNWNTHKSIIRSKWNNTNWLLTQQTYTHLAHAWRVHESMHVWEIE